MISYTVKNLLDSQHTISVATEMYKNSSDSDIFTKLQLKNERYFNAGVMIIDYQKWQKSVKILELVQLLENNSQKINNWDQDLLNIYFEGNFGELNNYLNFKVYLNENDFKYTFNKKEEEEGIFLHYSGKFKPWSLKGALNGNSNFYHSYYKKLYEDEYHIYNARRLNTLKDLMKNLLNLKIFAARNSFTLFKYTFLSLRRKKRS